MNHAGVPEVAGPADMPGLTVTFAAAFGDDAMMRGSNFTQSFDA